MGRLRVLAFALALVSAVRGEAQTGDRPEANALSSMNRFGGGVPIQIEHHGFSFPVVDYIDQTGVRQQRRGVLAGKTVAPGTVLGIGFYETAPKSKNTYGEQPINGITKRSRRAAVGLSMRF